MGATLLRLALTGFRSRALTSVLTLVLVTVGAATLTVALHIGSVADAPWERTFRETNGAHILAFGLSRDIGRLAELPGVSEAAGPAPSVVTSFERGGRQFGLYALGVGVEPPAVERPLVTDGRWLSGTDDVVLERSFARALDIGSGDSIRAKTTRGFIDLVVVGTAVLASGQPYPDSQPGRAFVAPEVIALIQPDSERWGWTEALRLTEPERVADVLLQASALLPPGPANLEGWPEIRADATERHRTTGIVLSTFSVILLVAIGFVLATVVGGRALARSREIGLLKSVGFTPGQVSLLFLLEQLALGLVGSLAGVLLGAYLTPLVVRRSAELVGGVPVEVSLLRLVLIVLVVEAMITVVTLVPTLRGARFSVARGLAARGTARSPGLSARAVGLRSPVPIALGLRDALARPGRTVSTTLALALSVGSLVAGLAMEATFNHEDAAAAAAVARVSPDPAGLAPAGPDQVSAEDSTRAQLRPVVHGLNGVLFLVAVVNLLATALLAVRERVRDVGVLRAIGLTPKQVSASVFAANGLAGLVAALVGIPLGLALFLGVYEIVNGNTELAVFPAWWVLALVPAATALALVAVSALPARRAARLQVVDALRYE
jgi:putative ABC transport system permease protein